MSNIYLGWLWKWPFPNFSPFFSEQDSFMPNNPTQGLVLCTPVLNEQGMFLIRFDLIFPENNLL